MSTFPPLSPESFSEFFQALWGHSPFPWQQNFATRVCAGETPDYVTVPTGSGKTACLDATVFALAYQAAKPVEERTVGRRIFFIVNRRIIVDEAFDRAGNLAQKLISSLNHEDEKSDILEQVAWWLKQLSAEDSAPPLSHAELRGGIYRDRAWVRSLTQPTIVCSTVDQAGSRLLFRGYGVSPEARPIHAALVAQDSFLIIDEAHISLPFLETLDWVRKYRVHSPANSETVALPFSVVRLTATPPTKDAQITRLDLSNEDREHKILQPRLNSIKSARLVSEPKAKGKNFIHELSKRLVDEAHKIITESTPKPRSIAIMVNRVATARAVAELMSQKKYEKANVTLLIGRMRPLDRDRITEDLQNFLKTGFKQEEIPLQIVVSTQCLEVGADFDFDALVTECASLDALRQRFGRLNRGGRDIKAPAVIVIPESQKVDVSKLSDEKPADVIYGNATPRTWHWLNSIATDSCVDFGLNVMTAAVQTEREINADTFDLMLMPRASAPILLPAYLDCWAQTNPAPAADPDVSLFLHGPQRDMAEVQVCWRTDLPETPDAKGANWAETLSLCPPTTLECLPVPIHLMRQWLREGSKLTDETGDAPGLQETETFKPDRVKAKVLIWEGAERSRLVNFPEDIRPGNTLILRTQNGGWKDLGHVPETESIPLDLAEEGQSKLRKRAYFRLHPALQPEGEKGIPWTELLAEVKKQTFDARSEEVREILKTLLQKFDESTVEHTNLTHLLKYHQKIDVEFYPDASGIVLSTHVLLSVDDKGSDEAAEDLLDQSKKQSLDSHTEQVVELTQLYSEKLGLQDFTDTLTSAAKLHDLGKADPRFQAILINNNLAAAAAQPVLWAKSDRIPTSAASRKRAREIATLPPGFRHELLSTQLAATSAATSLFPAQENRRELGLHVITTHHGYARPFPPVVADLQPPDVEVSTQNVTLSVSAEERLNSPAHALDSGMPERFWQLIRLHGWWGLPLLEAIVRLADQTASAQPQHD